MKKILVIGSTVVDMVINVDKLPTSKADIHIKGQRASMGGCAYNVSDTIRNFGTPNILFSPVGSGIYGDFVRNGLAKQGLTCPIAPVDMDNGCCYCFVEENGERTFVVYHGAEYLFYKEWFDQLDMSEIHSIYVCGLEIEEKTGSTIVSFLEENADIPVFYAPGPRLMRIDARLQDRLFALHPVIHLNDDEVKEFAGTDDVKQAMQYIYSKTGNTVIVTLGADGATWYDGADYGFVPTVKNPAPVDTIGAGDSHIGAVMACLYNGDTIETAVAKANKVATAVVGVSGALLPKADFDKALAE